eukprot:GHVS01061750.1.p1 GENE.GHVS01061750.1~~GHVS01061750.1.p1  ORF type:complete len:1235 (+),score=231.79 GHVS01061750.1:338-4042(+)
MDSSPTSSSSCTHCSTHSSPPPEQLYSTSSSRCLNPPNQSRSSHFGRLLTTPPGSSSSSSSTLPYSLANCSSYYCKAISGYSNLGAVRLLRARSDPSLASSLHPLQVHTLLGGVGAAGPLWTVSKQCEAAAHSSATASDVGGTGAWQAGIRDAIPHNWYKDFKHLNVKLSENNALHSSITPPVQVDEAYNVRTQIKELIRSQGRTWRHFPLIRNVLRGLGYNPSTHFDGLRTPCPSPPLSYSTPPSAVGDTAAGSRSLSHSSILPEHLPQTPDTADGSTAANRSLLSLSAYPQHLAVINRHLPSAAPVLSQTRLFSSPPTARPLSGRILSPRNLCSPTSSHDRSIVSSGGVVSSATAVGGDHLWTIGNARGYSRQDSGASDRRWPAPQRQRLLLSSGSSPAVSVCGSRGGGGLVGSDYHQQVTCFEILRCMIADTAAATIQRHVRGYWGRRVAAAAMQRLRSALRMYAAAARLQGHWRGWLCRKRLLLEAMVALLMRQRHEAATRIQKVWRNWVAQMNYQYEHLTLCLMETRQYAAEEVQRVWRGWHSRRVIDEEWTHWVIKWVWDAPGTIVEVVGDFSNPPWTKRYLMNYCRVRQCFVLVLPRTPGRYEVKFIVNGQYVCDGGETVISDGAGHFNNVVRVQQPVESPLERIRDNQLRTSHLTSSDQYFAEASIPPITPPSPPQEVDFPEDASPLPPPLDPMVPFYLLGTGSALSTIGEADDSSPSASALGPEGGTCAFPESSGSRSRPPSKSGHGGVSTMESPDPPYCPGSSSVGGSALYASNEDRTTGGPRDGSFVNANDAFGAGGGVAMQHAEVNGYPTAEKENSVDRTGIPPGCCLTGSTPTSLREENNAREPDNLSWPGATGTEAGHPCLDVTCAGADFVDVQHSSGQSIQLLNRAPSDERCLADTANTTASPSVVSSPLSLSQSASLGGSVSSPKYEPSRPDGMRPRAPPMELEQLSSIVAPAKTFEVSSSSSFSGLLTDSAATGGVAATFSAHMTSSEAFCISTSYTRADAAAGVAKREIMMPEPMPDTALESPQSPLAESCRAAVVEKQTTGKTDGKETDGSRGGEEGRGRAEEAGGHIFVSSLNKRDEQPRERGIITSNGRKASHDKAAVKLSGNCHEEEEAGSLRPSSGHESGGPGPMSSNSSNRQAATECRLRGREDGYQVKVGGDGKSRGGEQEAVGGGNWSEGAGSKVEQQKSIPAEGATLGAAVRGGRGGRAGKRRGNRR